MRAGSVDMSNDLQERVYLFVPYEERREAFRAGAEFDDDRKAWYRLQGQDPAPFARWANPPRPLTEREKIAQFAQALADAGLEVEGDPIMDGAWHRTSVTTSRNHRALKGAYIGRITDDGADGFIDNKDSGVKFPWKVKGSVSPGIRAQSAQAEADAAKRRADLHEGHKAVAEEARQKWSELREVTDQHPYLERKKVEALGLRRSGSRLAVPVCDADGALWNIQYINEDGQKLFMKGAAKEGHFHTLGELRGAPLALACEGYATGASLHMATGLPVVVVFDSGNYRAVLEQIQSRFPNTKWLLCGDDDVVNDQSVLNRLNAAAESKRGTEMQIGAITGEDLNYDGVPRPLVNSPENTLQLQYSAGPSGLPRVVGAISRKDQVIPILIRNAGREAVLGSVESFKCGSCFPKFTSLEGRPTDWNDLHTREGLTSVAQQVVAAIREQGLCSDMQLLANRVLGGSTQVVAPENSGRYVGQVVANVGTHVLQGVGRQTAVAHSVLDLDRVPREAKAVAVTYREGRGFVDPIRRIEREGHGR